MIDAQRKNDLNEFLDSIDINCDDFKILNQALTHSSYTYENKLDSLLNNERLEFLGDAVLKLIASDYLMDRFQNYPEGELTKIRSILVSDATLTKIAKRINLDKYLLLGFHEEKMGGRKRSSNLACAFEALLGALFLDGKMNEIKIFLTQQLKNEVTSINENPMKNNPKALIQEYTQAKWGSLPEYKVINEEGPPHKKIFEIEILINDEPIANAKGNSKKEAQQQAAQNAAINLKLIDKEDKL